MRGRPVPRSCRRLLQADLATAAEKKVERLAEETVSRQATAAETSKQLASGTKPLAAARRKKTLAATVGLGLLGVAGIVVLAAVISIRTSKGALEIATDDPDVKVEVKQNGDLVKVLDAKSGWTISLNSGEYEVAPQGSTDQFQLDKNSVVVKRGGTVKVTVTLKPVPPISDHKSEISESQIPASRRWQFDWSRR